MLYRDGKGGKVLLAKFSGSKMEADNTGKSTSKLEEFWRVKTYVKPEEMLNPDYPVFRQPYAIAQAKMGGNWNDYNAPFTIQVGGCNLKCWFCYVDRDLLAEDESRGGWFDAEEVYKMWLASGSNILRLSGGEPTMAPQFIIDLIETSMSYSQPKTPFIWIDSNMSTGDRFFDVYNKAPHIGKHMDGRVGMVGCFKGFTNAEALHNTCVPDLLPKQFEFARRLVEDTEIEPFFYVPDSVLPKTEYKDIENFFLRMQNEIHPLAPLRTHILKIKQYTPTEQGEWNRHTGRLQDCGRRPIDVWKGLCEEYIDIMLNWLPSEQINLREK